MSFAMSIPDRGGAGSTTDAVTTVTTVGYGDTFPLTLTTDDGAWCSRGTHLRSMPDFDSLTVTQTARPLIGLPPRARAGVARSDSLPKCRTRIGIPTRWVARGGEDWRARLVSVQTSERPKVKDQYVGDISDFFKYALLRRIQAAGGKLVVCWMLTESDGGLL